MIDGYRDWLGELRTALTVATVLGAVAGIGTVAQAVTADAVELTIQTAGAPPYPGLPPRVSLSDGGAMDVTVADPTWAERFASVAVGVPSYLLGMVIIVALWRIVRTALRTDPFAAGPARGLRRLGIGTLVGGLVADVLRTVAGALGSTLVYDDGWALSASYSWWWLLLGFGLVAVGEVLRRGAAMRAELEEVV
ncbi:DUF2975 domain-containing protein [Catenuloplanes atrovinosus]|uniref:DUF2975 domain-containing protein n=1 Tax=Catenuloplanes atrovinosus TaxID=137266 RepID=A0AAE4CBS4_9ACTN|nr:DUF2975 domain-containing protein [Catenuloplanes atrovinosus]MDR7278352.1 hypothetical protein [Catenuloplanes atrovinosus]